HTQGHYDFINITEKVSSIVGKTGVKDGVALVFVAGSTAALTIMEYEEYIQLDVWELPQYPAQRKFMFNSSDGVKFMVEEREIYVKLVEEPLG
ncbi:MAG: YjbQ family protein, partial [Nanoarchaeota archaeon]